MLLLKSHFYLGYFNKQRLFFFFQWASFSLAEALKISKGGNALKHLISSQEAEQRGGRLMLGGSIYTNIEIFLGGGGASCGLEFSLLAW